MALLNRRAFLARAGGTALLTSASDWVGVPEALAASNSATEGNEPATVFWKSGAGPGQVAVLAGHGLEHATFSVARLNDGASSDSTNAEHSRWMAGLQWQRR
jgi:hypothetical protein